MSDHVPDTVPDARTLLHDHVAAMPYMEREMCKMKYGLLGGYQLRVAEIQAIFKLTAEQTKLRLDEIADNLARAELLWIAESYHRKN